MSIDTPWRILVVDDEEGIHGITRMIFRGYRFEDRPIELISAHSGAEARQLLARHDDICLALLDVVMESDDEGLRLVNHIRDELGNRAMRIILRTGHPGFAPETEVIVRYDINDYLSKAELSAARLLTSVVVALRSWRDIQRAQATTQPSDSRSTEPRTDLPLTLARPLLQHGQAQLERLHQMALSPMAQELAAEVRCDLLRLGWLLDQPSARVQPQPTAPQALLEQCIRDLLPYARQQRRLLDYRIEGTLPDLVALDPQQTGLLWRALLDHALSAVEGPDLVVTLRHTHPQLSLRVQADGPAGQPDPSEQQWWRDSGAAALDRLAQRLGGQLLRHADSDLQLDLEVSLRADR